jgi:hypothetical protein
VLVAISINLPCESISFLNTVIRLSISTECRTNIKNAVDIDDTTGITNKQIKLSNGRMTNGSFSGIFRVMKVKSEFNRGQFIQILDLIRLPAEQVMIEDVSSSSTNAVVTKPPVAAASDLPGTTLPREATPEVPTVDAKLKSAGSSTNVNPVSDIAGTGTVAQSDKPESAAPAVADQTQNANPSSRTELTLVEQVEKTQALKKEFLVNCSINLLLNIFLLFNHLKIILFIHHSFIVFKYFIKLYFTFLLNLQQMLRFPKS